MIITVFSHILDVLHCNLQSVGYITISSELDVTAVMYIFELGKHCKTTHTVLHIVQEIAPWLYIHQTLHMSAR